MDARRLRHLVTVQSRTVSLNSYREDTSSWATYCTAWACIEPLSGREFLSAAALQSDVAVRITVRAEDVEGVTPQHRVLWNGKTYDIVSVVNVFERGRWAQLMCKAAVLANVVTASGEVVTAGGETVTATP